MAKNFVKLVPALVVAFLCALGVTVSPTFAEEPAETPAIWLQISPVSNRITLNPGEIIEDEFTVENIGTDAFDYKVYATPYYATSTAENNYGYDLNFSVENNYTQIARWVKFADVNGNYAENVTFHVNPGEKQTIKYRVEVPNDIPAGGQYATLFAESIDNSPQESTGIKTVSRVGLVLYANANGETRQEASISDYDFTKFLLGGKLKASAKVTNNGNTDFSASYKYTVKTLFGKTLLEKEESYFLLPETTRAINFEWGETPFMGIFQVTYKVSALGTTEEHSSVVLVLPIFMMIIALVLLTIIIIWIIILIRKRNERKSRLLV